MTPSQDAERLVTKTLPCEDVYEEYALSKIFIESMDALIRHNESDYLRGKKKANVHELQVHATWLFRFQRHELTSKC